MSAREDILARTGIENRGMISLHIPHVVARELYQRMYEDPVWRMVDEALYHEARAEIVRRMKHE